MLCTPWSLSFTVALLAPHTGQSLIFSYLMHVIVSSIFCQSSCSLQIEFGELYSWGHGGYGQLGHNEPDKSVPVQVKLNLGDRKIELVACGSYHSVAQTTNGEVRPSGKIFVWPGVNFILGDMRLCH